MKQKLLIHIGFPKAASTTLQRTVFPKSDKFVYLGKDDGVGGDRHLMPVNNFINDLAFAEDRDLPESFKIFDDFIKSEELRRCGKNNRQTPLLLSHETFLAVLLKPVNTKCGLYVGGAPTVFKRLSDFGKQQNYSVELILIKREFRDFVFSWYSQMYHLYQLTQTTNSLIKYLRSECDMSFIKSGLYWFYDNNLEHLLYDIFGNKNVHVFNFGELVENPKSESHKRLESLLETTLPDFKNNIYNKRTVDTNKKIGALVATSRQKKSFVESVKAAWQTFKLNYYPSSKITKTIEWNKECDILYDRMIYKFEKETISNRSKKPN